jgi:hypothetical protein
LVERLEAEEPARKTPDLVEGGVSKLDRSQGKLTVRDGDGKE